MIQQLSVLLMVVIGMAIVPFISRRILIPVSVLEILLGFVLFHTVIEHTSSDFFHILKELGFIYLMFIAGMELDIKKIVKEPRFKWFLIIPLLSLITGPIMFHLIGFPFYLGVSVSVFGAGILLPLLKESGLIKTELGRLIFGVTMMGEVISIAFLTLLDVYHRTGLTVDLVLELLRICLEIVAAAIVLKLLYIIAWWLPRNVEKVMESQDPVEEGVRLFISTALAGGILAYYSGLEPILGSFIAGLIFSYIFKSKGRFEEKINALGFGFFIPFFFIGIGADFDPNLVLSKENIKMALILSFFIFVSNIFPILFMRWLKLRFIDALAMVLLLSAPMTMIVVAGSVGSEIGFISKETNGVLVVAAMFSSVAYPSLFRIISGRLKEGNE